MTPRHRVILQLLAPLFGAAITALLLFAWFSLQARLQPPVDRTGLVGVEPVVAYTDPFIPDPRELPDCARPGACEEIPEAAWPQVREVRDRLFLACPDGTSTRRGGVGEVAEFVQYRGLQALGSSPDQVFHLAVTYDSERWRAAAAGWQPWQYNGDGGVRSRAFLATLSRSDLSVWDARIREDLRAVDFTCADLPQ